MHDEHTHIEIHTLINPSDPTLKFTHTTVQSLLTHKCTDATTTNIHPTTKTHPATSLNQHHIHCYHESAPQEINILYTERDTAMRAAAHTHIHTHTHTHTSEPSAIKLKPQYVRITPI